MNLPAQNITNTTAFLVQPTQAAVSVSATLTIAQLLTNIITNASGSAATYTLPTGTLTDAGVLGGAGATNVSFDWYVINLGTTSGAVTGGGATKSPAFYDGATWRAF